MSSIILVCLMSCGTDPDGLLEVTVPSGSTFSEVTDTLVNRGLIGAQGPFKLYARIRGDDRRIKSGRYELHEGNRWRDILEKLTKGEVMTVPMTVPEGFRMLQIAPRISEVTGVAEDSVLSVIDNPDLPASLGIPGPTSEGYLFPDTYRFAPGVSVESVLKVMADRYHSTWSEARLVRLKELDMTENELVTLASIIQAEARHNSEMPRISSVYHNRLREGWLLQADPTVLFALGGPRSRLLYAAIDSVADHPYNTYSQPGLPPGPICSPGDLAIAAALNPAQEDFMYFVARPDGRHVFTRTLAEHNRAKLEAQRARDRISADEHSEPTR
ncbi:MAG: endolytic transglycosylase MltG [Longimicrobiales bacterium]|nr:endolytic transglycosylase MltG [Longimicrobiales bacterium]